VPEDVALDPRLVSGSVEAPDAHVEPGPKDAREFGDVDARPAIDVRGVLTGEDVDAHGSTLSRPE
jgi:hypothetical protein